MEYVRKNGGELVVRLRNKLDYHTASALIEEIKLFEKTNISRLDFYCAELEYVSSAGIRSLIYIRNKMDMNAVVRVVMHNVAKPVRDIFILNGLDGYFEFTD